MIAHQVQLHLYMAIQNSKNDTKKIFFSYASLTHILYHKNTRLGACYSRTGFILTEYS